MFWWFERNGKFLRYEARPGSDGGFELCIVDVDGTERVERFEDSADLAKRQRQFEEQILQDGWTGPHGWNV